MLKTFQLTAMLLIAGVNSPATANDEAPREIVVTARQERGLCPNVALRRGSSDYSAHRPSDKLANLPDTIDFLTALTRQ